MQRTKDHATNQKPYSKASKEGLGILVEEIELASQWNRPGILLVVHKSKTGRADTQCALEREVAKKNKKVTYINIESIKPDVIRVMSEMPNSENTIFFVAGIENADQASGGKVYRALNMRRELLVERRICVVFWLNESEAASLPRLAPDFWAFRHRVIEFAPKHGSKKQLIPVGLFLWKEQIPWTEAGGQKNKLAYYEDILMQLPEEGDSVTARIEAILKLAHYSWLLNDLKKFPDYLKSGFDLLERYPIPQYQAWMLNAKAIGLYEEGNKKDANVHFTQALSCDPDNSTIMMNTGIAAHGMGKNRDAIQIGRRAIKKDAGNFHLWRALGYLFLSMGKTKDAVEAMEKAQRINPGSLDIHYSLAVCYHKNEQPDECRKEIANAEKISPPQNATQRAYIEILNGKTGADLAQLKHSLEKEEVGKRHILGDPNLHFLLNMQEFMVSN